MTRDSELQMLVVARNAVARVCSSRGQAPGHDALDSAVWLLSEAYEAIANDTAPRGHDDVLRGVQ